ncbi:MAG: hypothetical protein IJ752_01690 [Alphaproteobacteria bacterium]|nr:hypothetical protein [Alphaproteobacteria bacterium]
MSGIGTACSSHGGNAVAGSGLAGSFLAKNNPAVSKEDDDAAEAGRTAPHTRLSELCACGDVYGSAKAGSIKQQNNKKK